MILFADLANNRMKEIWNRNAKTTAEPELHKNFDILGDESEIDSPDRVRIDCFELKTLRAQGWRQDLPDGGATVPSAPLWRHPCLENRRRGRLNYVIFPSHKITQSFPTYFNYFFNSFDKSLHFIPCYF